MTYSIHDISVLLHVHTSPADWPYGATPAYVDSMDKLECSELIRSARAPHAPSPERRLPQYEATERGQAFIRMLQNTPLPVEQVQWVDPRTSESV